MGIDISGVLLAIRPDGRVSAFPQVAVNLGDASCTWFAPLAFVGLKRAGSGAPRCRCGLLLGFGSADTLIDLYRRCAVHFVGDVGVYVQRGAAGYMTDNGGECFDIHAMFQTCGAKYMSQIMESNLFTPSSLQNDLQPFSDGGGISGRIFADRGREHPSGGYRLIICFEDTEDRRRENNATIGGFCLGWRDYQFSLNPVDLPLDPEFSGAEVQVVPLQGADLAPA